MNETTETLNPNIRNSVDAENYLKSQDEVGAFFTWKSESDQFILSNNNNSNEIFNHIIIPVNQHKTLSEAISVLQSSFPRRYKHPIIFREGNTTDNVSNSESSPTEVSPEKESGEAAPIKTNITDLSVEEEALKMKSNLEAPLEAAKKPLTEEEKVEKLVKLDPESSLSKVIDQMSMNLAAENFAAEMSFEQEIVFPSTSEALPTITPIPPLSKDESSTDDHTSQCSSNVQNINSPTVSSSEAASSSHDVRVFPELSIEEQEITKMAELRRREKQNENTTLCNKEKAGEDEEYFYGFEESEIKDSPRG